MPLERQHRYDLIVGQHDTEVAGGDRGKGAAVMNSRTKSREGRDMFRRALGVDDATWARARGWAMRSVGGIDYYRDTNPAHSAASIAVIQAVLSCF